MKTMNELEEYEANMNQMCDEICIWPEEYKLDDPKNVEIFGKRLREVREGYPHHEKGRDGIPEERDIITYTQKELGEILGLSNMMISKYESGKIKKIPVAHFRTLFKLFGVTPAFLLGLVKKPDQVLLCKNGEFLRDPDGSYRTLITAMQFEPSPCRIAVHQYRTLYERDNDLFWLINKVICGSTQLKACCRETLRYILNL